MSRSGVKSRLSSSLARSCCVWALLLAGSSVAAPRAFPFTWDSGNFTAGQTEVRFALTEGIFKSTAVPYTKTGLELQVGLGINEHLETLFGFDADIEAFAVDQTRADARVSNTWRYSPLHATDVVGLSLAGTASLGFDVFGLELRAIADKQLGRVLLAANASVQRSVFWSNRTGVDQRFEQALAARFCVNEAFSAGLEGLAHEAFNGSAYQGTAFFVGPTFSYAGRRWWLSVGAMAQIAADKARADRGNGEPLEIRDNERFMVRVAFGARAD